MDFAGFEGLVIYSAVLLAGPGLYVQLFGAIAPVQGAHFHLFSGTLYRIIVPACIA